MFDKIRDFLSKSFSKTTEDPGYGHDDYALPAGLKTANAPAAASYTPDEVIGEVVTMPAQYFKDRGLDHTL